MTQAYENVRQMVRGLSEFNQNIRRYVEHATREKQISDLLRLQFDDYSQTLGASYHALKTSDHVSRYRRDIIDRLQNWQMDSEWLTSAANELALQSRLNPTQAEQTLAGYLQFIIHQLEGLDPLLEDIDQRHAQYLRTSLRQIRYQLGSADGSFKDRLVIARPPDLGNERRRRRNICPPERPACASTRWTCPICTAITPRRSAALPSLPDTVICPHSIPKTWPPCGR